MGRQSGQRSCWQHWRAANSHSPLSGLSDLLCGYGLANGHVACIRSWLLQASKEDHLLNDDSQVIDDLVDVLSMSNISSAVS